MERISGNKSSAFVLLFLVLGLAAPLAQAQLLRCQGADGRIVYRDQSSGPPGPGCRTVEDRTSVIAPMPLQGDAQKPPARAPGGEAPAKPVSGAGIPVKPGAVGGEQPVARPGTEQRAAESQLQVTQDKLEAARKALAQQQEVRYGDERNYQKVLDRLKPFADEVDKLEQELELLKRKASRQ